MRPIKASIVKRGSIAAFVYLCIFVASLFLPEIVKTIATGSTGPNTSFLAAIALSPAAFLLLGIFGGKRLFAIHLSLTLLAAGWAWISYPKNPSMDFMRQIAHELLPTLAVLYFVGWLASVMTNSSLIRARGGSVGKGQIRTF